MGFCGFFRPAGSLFRPVRLHGPADRAGYDISLGCGGDLLAHGQPIFFLKNPLFTFKLSSFQL
jgi:hypothetical protein